MALFIGQTGLNLYSNSASKYVSWADGTDEEIAAMLDAHYAGLINIYDYWHVGDERKVHLSAMSSVSSSDANPAQDVTMVILSVGGKELVTPINEKNECAFIVGQKNLLSVFGVMNKSDTNVGGWDSCGRRSWCNSSYRNAIPTTFRIIFKQHKNITSAGYGNFSSAIVSNDYFSIASVKEIFGTTPNTDSTAESKNKQFDYYKISSANKIKRKGDGGANAIYWTRSPRNIGGTQYVYMNVGGTGIGVNRANSSLGISPFGVI